MGWKTVVALCAALVLAGCMSSGTNIADSQLDQLVRGKTTEAEVIAKLGPPTMRDRDASGEHVLTYSYSHIAPSAQSFIPIVGGLIATMDMKGKMVRLTFTPVGVLKDWTSTENDMSSNNGLLNQH
jgi:outer membrane protein assembly factor BamE (lipoprotein component of BamABCDE complex)